MHWPSHSMYGEGRGKRSWFNSLENQNHGRRGKKKCVDPRVKKSASGLLPLHTGSLLIVSSPFISRGHLPFLLGMKGTSQTTLRHTLSITYSLRQRPSMSPHHLPILSTGSLGLSF